VSYALVLALTVSVAALAGPVRAAAASYDIGGVSDYLADGNVFVFTSGAQEVTLTLCTSRTVRIQLSTNGTYRGESDPLYYMVQKNDWAPVARTVTDEGGQVKIETEDMEIRISKRPLRVGMYDADGRLLSRDADDQGLYWTDDGVRGVKKVEGTAGAGGIFGFGTSDHGRTTALNRYGADQTNFSMDHGKILAPFFMSTVGYGIFLNTLEPNTKFFKQGGGFETRQFLDYYFLYGPDFKTILNEYAEITGRMEMYGKWAQGFMLSKYGADNATQNEFIQWIERLRREDYPTDVYVFDYGWRQGGAKWGAHHWDTSGRYPDLAAMFARADELGFRVGLHNNKGTPEAANGRLWIEENNKIWTDAHIDNVVATGYGDWFWPDEFDIPESGTPYNYMPTFSAKGPYEAWKAYTEASRPMFVTRGSYAGQHFATAWSGDISNTINEMGQQIAYHLTAGLIGYWATSHDLGGFLAKPSDALYTRWTAEFGAWNAIMRTHGHDGREPWLYDATAQNTLRKNLKIRYALYPYAYSLAWQGYSQGVPIMRPMLLEDDSRHAAAAWNLDRQYYYGDWFLVAPALDTKDTVVSLWLPPNTTWYRYDTDERYEGGALGKTITVGAALDEIPVFVKAGAIVPMGPAVNYADEKPLDPLTLDIYPKGHTTFTLYEDDGVSRRYLTQDAYSTTTFESSQSGRDISLTIHARLDHNPEAYQPAARSYNLKFNHIAAANGVTVNGRVLPAVPTLDAYNAAGEAWWLDTAGNILYVKTPDTGETLRVELDSDGVAEPPPGEEQAGPPLPTVSDGTVYELEDAVFVGTGANIGRDTEWGRYTGTGFAKGFKAAGCAAELAVNVKQPGVYDLILRVNNGKKNDNTDRAPRTGALYVNGAKILDMAFPITAVWGDTISNAKQGIWLSYTLPGVVLGEGRNDIRLVAEGSNPGNFNLDSLTFNLKKTNAFGTIEAESAFEIRGGAQIDDAACSAGGKIVLEDGQWTGYAAVEGAGKSAVRLRVRSGTGGRIVVQENGVGDKVLAEADVLGDGVWRTLVVPSLDTDAALSDIFLELRGDGASVEIDSFSFETDRATTDAYDAIPPISAARRFQIDTSSKTIDGVSYRFINHIDSGDWAVYEDIDFGRLGAAEVQMRYAAGEQGGVAEVRLDSLGGPKIAEVTFTKTANWNTLAYAGGVCAPVTGVHDVYLVFVNMNTARSICDLYGFTFGENADNAVQEVALTPDAAALVPGLAQPFAARVTAAGDADRSVIWGLAGHRAPGTAVSADGLLTVAPDETAGQLWVTATSVFDDARWAAAAVTLTPNGVALSDGVCSADGAVTVSVKNNWYEHKAVRVIAAAYGTSGALTGAAAQLINLDANTGAEVSFRLPPGQHTVKVFAWDAEGVPYTEALTLES
jgi:alpha-glucosidase (family GH31 glycosyl hydrolase)